MTTGADALSSDSVGAVFVGEDETPERARVMCRGVVEDAALDVCRGVVGRASELDGWVGTEVSEVDDEDDAEEEDETAVVEGTGEKRGTGG